ncbi:GNAT family N-acetyltransferase [Serratia fonticola]|uniref:GNAT family N-acetyltransferase n=1 Tax=Serratia fonticola TaxID=47917 RepID=UPI0039872611
MLDISAINNPGELNDETLRSRAKRSNGGWASEYIARIESLETALLVLDHFPNKNTAKIYEIFVLEPYRLKGIATELLKFAEARARGLGCTKIELDVHSLDASIHKGQLRAWYIRHGYESATDDQDKLQKIFHDVCL